MKYIVGIALEVQMNETLKTSGREKLSEAIAKKLGIPLGPDEATPVSGKQIMYIYDEDDECIFEC